MEYTAESEVVTNLYNLYKYEIIWDDTTQGRWLLKFSKTFRKRKIEIGA